jgi:hypothetical protein
MTKRKPPHLHLKPGRKALPADQKKAWTLADIKARCLVTLTDCWEYRARRKKLVTSPRSEQAMKLKHRGKSYLVRRLAWMLMHGAEPPAGKCLSPVKCGNQRCCNPMHAKPLTEAEKARMAVQRGSFSSPARRMAAAVAKQNAATAKLNAEKVRLIRGIQGPAWKHAPAFGISAGMFNRVRSRKSWANVP